jgi:hypothetical protein
MRERNIGWRLDMVLASTALADRTASCVVQREFGSSDHGPVVAVFGAPIAKEFPAAAGGDGEPRRPIFEGPGQL